MRGGGAATAPAIDRRTSLAARGLLVIRGLPEHTLLDRIVRGRAWIPLLGVLLAGIVAMQVEILKLGTSQGRWIERSSTLSTKNEALQANVAALMDDQRIESLAAKMGMVMPDPTALSFLSAQPGGSAAAAVANIHAPDPSSFSPQTSSVAATLAAQASGSSATATSSGTSSAGTPTATSTSSTSGTSGTSTDSSAASQSAGAPATGGTDTSPTAGTSSSGAASAPSDGSESAGSGGAASIAPSSSQSSATNGG